jgi:hypothetical protein
MFTCTGVRRLFLGSLLVILPVHPALAQPPTTPTEAEVLGQIEKLGRKNDPSAQQEALRWLSGTMRPRRRLRWRSRY